MPILQPFFDSLRPVILAALPAVDPGSGGGGIWQALEIRTQSFEKIAKEGKLPLVALDPRFTGSGGWGIGNKTWDGTLTIYYVVHLESDIEGLFTPIETLKEALFDARPSFDRGAIVGEPWPDWGMDLPPNRYFSSANKPYNAAALICPVIVQRLDGT